MPRETENRGISDNVTNVKYITLFHSPLQRGGIPEFIPERAVLRNS